MDAPMETDPPHPAQLAAPAEPPPQIAAQIHPHDGQMQIDSPHDAAAANLPAQTLRPPSLADVTDFGQGVRDTATFRWKIADWAAILESGRITSPEFVCDGLRWRFLLFPKGNKHQNAISIFLESVDATEFSGTKSRWHTCISFGIYVANASDESIFDKFQFAQHRYASDATDWGFSNFCKVQPLQMPADGFLHPIMENNSIVFVVLLKVLDDPYGTLWNTFQDWNSREETGYIGLRNQGATCYLNSLLQSLYFTNYFRKATFQIPTENDEPKKSVPLALQRLFYNMQFSPYAIGTTELTRSFGWDTSDAFLQHDVQELNRVLQDNLESKMKGTTAEGAIRKLFTGKMKSFIKCLNVDFESSRIEDFYDIQLNVKGCKNLHDSFVEYCAIETLDGDNKYFAEGHGLQDAKKGVVFTQFPPVLHLQLKRFEYDIERDMLVKMNDRHEFPITIDLDDFLEQPDPNQPQRYHLHGVLVHSGELHAGHYCAFIRPSAEPKWFKFDDDRVIPVSVKEVLEDNYGGDPVVISPDGQQTQQLIRARHAKRFTNAYMLVYIRESDVDEILSPISKEDVPEHLHRQFEEERALAEQRQKEEEEAHLYTTVRVLTNGIIRQHEGHDLCYFEERNNHPATEFLSVRVLKNDPFSSLVSKIAAELHVNDENVRLWTLSTRQNKSTRPDSPIPESLYNKNIDEIKLAMNKGNELRLYAEVSEQSVYNEVVEMDGVEIERPVYFYPRIPNMENATALLFIKFYDPLKPKLQFVGTYNVPDMMAPISTIFPALLALKNLPETTRIWLYEEIKPSMIETVDIDCGFKAGELGDGDILCFQIEPTDEDREKMADPSLTEAPQYYEYLATKIDLTFKPKDRLEAGKGDVELTLSRKMTYDKVVSKLAAALDYDEEKLRLWSCTNSVVPTPKAVIRRTSILSLNEMIGGSFYHTGTNILFYETLSVSVSELETKRYVKVVFVDAALKEDGPHELLVPKNAVYHDVLHALIAKIGFTGPEENVRLFEVAMGRIMRICNSKDPIANLPEQSLLLAEEISQEEIAYKDDDVKVVPVMHFSRDAARHHGTPFTFVLRLDEPISETRQRLMARTGMSEKDFSKVKLAQVNKYRIVRYFENENEPLPDDFTITEPLGLDHPDKSGRSNRIGVTEKSIKILN